MTEQGESHADVNSCESYTWAIDAGAAVGLKSGQAVSSDASARFYPQGKVLWFDRPAVSKPRRGECATLRADFCCRLYCWSRRKRSALRVSHRSFAWDTAPAISGSLPWLPTVAGIFMCSIRSMELCPTARPARLQQSHCRSAM